MTIHRISNVIDGKKINGYMLTGWQKVNGKWYYLDPASGEMLTGWLKYDGEWYS